MLSTSIKDHAPDDDSGRRSRGGYEYQDLCGLRYCVHVAHNGGWDEIWCESHEDLVLYRRTETKEIYRFVQSKFQFNADSHWSVPNLCKYANTKTITDSIICKIFLKDKYLGHSDFRLVTNEGANAELSKFHYHWGRNEPVIKPDCPELESFKERLVKWTPPHGRAVADYIVRFAIEQHAKDASEMENAILRELDRFLRSHNLTLLFEELERVFKQLYHTVHQAACVDRDQPGNPERISRTEFTKEATSSAAQIAQATTDLADTAPTQTLRNQMEPLGVGSQYIKEAASLRLGFYSAYRRHSGTQLGRDLKSALDDVRAISLAETIKVTGAHEYDGMALLRAVLTRVTEVHEATYRQMGVSLSLMHGMCYFLIARGTLRLNK